jgi:hypothetical protein
MHEFRKLSEGVYAFLQPALVWYVRRAVLSSYCELGGKMPESKDPGETNHMTTLRKVADEALNRMDKSGLLPDISSLFIS